VHLLLERKSAADFLDSLRSGRLAAQLDNMVCCRPLSRVLILEGEEKGERHMHVSSSVSCKGCALEALPWCCRSGKQAVSRTRSSCCTL